MRKIDKEHIMWMDFGIFLNTEEMHLCTIIAFEHLWLDYDRSLLCKVATKSNFIGINNHFWITYRKEESRTQVNDRQ